MAKEVYLTIDGKQVALTDEQLKALGLYEEPKRSPFKRVEDSSYYAIVSTGEVDSSKDYDWGSDKKRYKVANYCTDKALMQQRAYHEILNRLLWRFSIENNGDKIDWNNPDQEKYYIFLNDDNNFEIECTEFIHDLNTYFYTETIAQRAIDEIVLPFIKEHPNFVW